MCLMLFQYFVMLACFLLFLLFVVYVCCCFFFVVFVYICYVICFLCFNCSLSFMVFPESVSEGFSFSRY